METKERDKGTEAGLCLLQEEQPFLLELFMRIPHLSGLYVRKPLGNDVQQHYLGVPRLRQNPLLLTADFHGFTRI